MKASPAKSGPSRRDILAVGLSEWIAVIPTALLLGAASRLLGGASPDKALPAAAAAFAGLGLCALVWGGLSTMLARFFMRRDYELTIVRLAFGTFVLAWPALWLGERLLRGTKFGREDELGLPHLVLALTLALGFSLLFSCGWRTISQRRLFKLPRALVFFLLLATALLISWFNLRVLVKQYPLWHLVAALFGFGASIAAFALVADRLTAKLRWIVAAVGGIALLLTLFAGADEASAIEKNDGASRILRFVDREITQRWRKRPEVPAADLARIEGRWGQSDPDQATRVFEGLGTPRPRSVILITIDTLRADRTGFGGYDKRPTTPFLDELAKESLVFERAYAQAPNSLPSVLSFFTGRYPESLNYWRKKADEAPRDDERTLAEHLRRQGFSTLGVPGYTAEHLKSVFRDFGRGFEDYRIFEDKGVRDARRTCDDFSAGLREIQKDGARRAFSWMHFIDVHGPFPSKTSPYGSEIGDLYDHATLRVDEALRDFWTKAQKEGLLDETLVIFHSDHGEELWDHGGLYHGSELYEEQIHVPLMMWMGGQVRGRIDEPVELVDLAPTIYESLGVPAPPALQGDSLVPCFAGEEPSGLAISQVPPGSVVGRTLIGHIDGDMKVIRDVDTQKTMIFDLASDPKEQAPRSRVTPATRQGELTAINRAAELLCRTIPERKSATNTALEDVEVAKIIDWSNADEARAQLAGDQWKMALESLWRHSPAVREAAEKEALKQPGSSPERIRNAAWWCRRIAIEPRSGPELRAWPLWEAFDAVRQPELFFPAAEAIGELARVDETAKMFLRRRETGHLTSAHRLAISVAGVRALKGEHWDSAIQYVRAQWPNTENDNRQRLWPILVRDPESEFHDALIASAISPDASAADMGFALKTLHENDSPESASLLTALRLRDQRLAGFDRVSLANFRSRPKEDLPPLFLYRVYETQINFDRLLALALIDRQRPADRSLGEELDHLRRRFSERRRYRPALKGKLARKAWAPSPESKMNFGLSARLRLETPAAPTKALEPGALISGTLRNFGEDQAVPAALFILEDARFGVLGARRLPPLKNEDSDSMLSFVDQQGRTVASFRRADGKN